MMDFEWKQSVETVLGCIDTIEMRQCVAVGLINDLSTNTDRYCTVNGPFVSVFSTGSRFDPHIPLLRWSFRQKCLQVPLAPVSRSSLSSLIINQTIPFSNKQIFSHIPTWLKAFSEPKLLYKMLHRSTVFNFTAKYEKLSLNLTLINLANIPKRCPCYYSVHQST